MALRWCFLVIGLWAVLAGRPAWAYIDMPAESLTLPRLLLEFRSAGIYAIERLDLERGAARLQLVRSISGFNPPQVRQVIRLGQRPPESLRALTVGQQVVLLGEDPYGRSLTFTGRAWYVCTWDRASRWWLIGYTDAYYDFGCAFVGRAPDLTAAIESLLRGDEATVQCRRKGKTPQTQWVRCTLRRPHEKLIAPGPVQTQPANGSPQAASLDALLASIERADAGRRIDVLRELGRRGDAASTAAPAVLALLQADADPFVRRACAAALPEISASPAAAIPHLLPLLKHGYSTPEALVTSEPAAAIRRLDPDGQLTVPMIVAMLQDPKPAVRSRGAVAATLLRTYAKPAAPALVEALRDAEPDVRYQSAVALRLVEADPLLAAPALARCLADPNKDVLDPVTRALIAMAPESVDALGQALSHDNPQVRKLAARALADIGPAAKPALPSLRSAAKRADPQAREEAAKAIQRIDR